MADEPRGRQLFEWEILLPGRGDSHLEGTVPECPTNAQQTPAGVEQAPCLPRPREIVSAVQGWRQTGWAHLVGGRFIRACRHASQHCCRCATPRALRVRRPSEQVAPQQGSKDSLVRLTVPPAPAALALLLIFCSAAPTTDCAQRSGRREIWLKACRSFCTARL